MAHLKRPSRRTSLQVDADDACVELAQKLGRMVRDGRLASHLTQRASAEKAGISQSEWSGLERGRKLAAVVTWNRAAFAVGRQLDAWIKDTSAADQPRDAVHLRNQELVIATALAGGWRSLPEEPLDRDAGRSRAADVLLHRHREGVPAEYCLCEIWDWIEDVGSAVRDFGRRLPALDRYAVSRMAGDDAVPTTAGFWLVRATQRNRQLIGHHRNFFRARFPGSAHAWLAALMSAAAPPADPALLWASVDGTRIFPARLR